MRSQKYSISVVAAIAAGAALFMVPALFAQTAPASSRGIQDLHISHGECVARAKRALEAEGYGITNEGAGPGDYFYAGFKGIHAAVITCDSGAEGRVWANVFVASISTDGGVPGAERVKIQQRMVQPTSESGPVKVNWWLRNAAEFRGRNAMPTYVCPPGGDPNLGTIWGTDHYTDDSPVCKAAVHAGLITFANGGEVTFDMRQGAQSFQGSTRNGVESHDFGAWGSSYVFVSARADTQGTVSFDRGETPRRTSTATPTRDSRFLGSWNCACKLAVVLNADGTGAWVDSRGGPPGSMYESGRFEGTWTTSGDNATFVIPPKYGNRSGMIVLALRDGRLYDQFGDVYIK